MPRDPLSLPAALCLLAWDPARPDTARVHHLVRAGGLVELARRGLLTDDDGIATPVDLDSETGDPVLDGLLELVRESLPHGWRTWVARHARVTFDAVREQLVAEGCLRAEKKRVLGVFPSVEYTLARPDVAQALRRRARDVLEGAVAAGEVSARDAAVAALAAAAAEPGVAAGAGCPGGVGAGAEGSERTAEPAGHLAAAPDSPGMPYGVLDEVCRAVRDEAAHTKAPAGG
ncbi:GOLPH3/VPS74 family protein [Streptomyces sp. enrichment culture]|uniref:GOLPH3/VPS74 family protein n=1 Tax=Streptomyces sp. enrichment culture TaxID=1795815 RepID=UPI003F54B2CC